MPPQGTEIATRYDQLYMFIVVASAISCLILIGGMIYFAVKYRRKSENDKTPYISHNTFLEFLWSFIPFVIFMVVFGWGWWLYHDMRKMPSNALEVHVYGKQWAWEFVYKNGKAVSNEFVVPVGVPVKLIMTSKDVIHSFFIPSMRIKQDVVPGRYTAQWFEATKTGDYHVFCTEYCGAAHSNMLAKMKVVSMADYENWLQVDESSMTLVEKGQKYYNDYGCSACHSLDGKVQVGPSIKGLWGNEREMADGQKVVADEAYIKESILVPTAKTVKGFGAGLMPSFQGQLSEDQITAIIEFIKGAK
jgi:cytochrome c oxidase subunit 2